MLYTPLKSIGNNYIQFQTSLFALDRNLPDPGGPG